MSRTPTGDDQVARRLSSLWTTANWIGRPSGEVSEVQLTGSDEDRPDVATTLRPPAYLRRRFTLDTPAESASLDVSAHGVYRVFINGHRVGDDVLAPGWTDYAVRVHVQSFDVTDLLVSGENVICAILADGWYSGFVGFDRGHQARLWGDIPLFRAALVAHTSGRPEPVEVTTDGTWRRSSGRYVYSDLQMGEMQDATREPLGWQDAAFDDSPWRPVEVVSFAGAEPVAHRSPGPPIRVMETLAAVSITWEGDGRCIVDFGQNLTGVVRLVLRDQPRGTRVHLRHAEVLDDAGQLYVDNLRSALARDIYVCAGEPDEVFEPHFTFHGFRYAELSGLSGRTLETSDVSALVIHSAVERVGAFECSDPRIDKLHENIAWTIRGNLVDVPTDCPQRDERLGWLGDAQLIMPTASYLFDLDGFLAKWTEDIRDAQSPAGAFPDVAPKANVRSDGAPGWADAGAIVPWTAYLASGSRGHLEANYSAMARWVDLLVRENPRLVRERGLNHNYGDWLNLAAPTPKPLLATAYLALDVEIMHHAAAALGREADAREYAELWERVRDAFVAEYVSADGAIAGETQTAYAMALHLDLVPEETRDRAARRLADNLAGVGHLTTGIHGTRFLLPALSDIGRSDLAYELIGRSSYPSWLHAVASGATTIWERWDGWTADRGFQRPGMNSFNHYALGSVGEWLNRYVAGISPDPARPGFEHTLVRPYPSASLGYAGSRRRTRNGEVSSRWELDGSLLSLEVVVPAGGSATVAVPTTDPGSVVADADVSTSSVTGGWASFDVGSGSFRFDATLAPGWTPADRIPEQRLRSTISR
jgi:alpha-L-rhamnosidase